MLSSAVKEALNPDTEFWSSSKTLVTLAEGDYFKTDDNVIYPDKLKKFLGSGKHYDTFLYLKRMSYQSYNIEKLRPTEPIIRLSKVN